MTLEMGSYWPLLLLAGIPYVLWVRRQTARSLSPEHSKRLTAVRSLVVAFLVLALTRPVWYRPGTWTSVVYLLDVSASVDPSGLESSLHWISAATERAAPEHAAYVAFADRPFRARDIGHLRSVPVSSRRAFEYGIDVPSGAIDQSRTNIGSALSFALRCFAPRSLKRLVLITDGHSTEGDFMEAVAHAQSQGVRVFTVPAAARGESDVSVDSVESPETVRRDEPFTAEARIFAKKPTRGVVTIRSLTPRAQTLAAREVELEPGVHAFGFDLRIDQPGPLSYEVQVYATGDPTPQNNRWVGYLQVGPHPKVLYIEGHPESAGYLRDALVEEGLDVVVTSGDGCPESAEGLAAYDAVLVSDVAATSLGEARMEALKRYVRDSGGGLVFVAGETSFGASGYAGTPMEELLPVRFATQEKRKDLALIVTLDKSYSMDGEKIELAKEATKAALDLLDETHEFGVIAFDWYPHIVVPLQSAKDKAALRESISRLKASAPTRIYPALEKAHEQLAASRAKVKHVILLSDGKTYKDDFESLVKQMAIQEMTLSTVAVGDEADRELLTSLSEWGNGRSYFVESAARVPEIFIREAEIAAEATLVETAFRPIVKRTVEALRGIDFLSAPSLRGYVSTRPKEMADVWMSTESGSPVLVRWYYGTGKAVAFTSDAKNRWAVDWLRWPGYGRFWAQVVRETMRREQSGPVEFRARREGEKGVITLSALDADGHFRNELTPRVEIVEPGGTRRLQDLLPVGPGLFEASTPLQPHPISGYQFELKAPELGPDGSLGKTALFMTYLDELRLRPPNEPLLRSVSSWTGGVFAPEIEEIVEDHGERAVRPVALWPWLTGMALFGYLVDITIRRIPWLWERLLRWPPGSVAAGSGRA